MQELRQLRESGARPMMSTSVNLISKIVSELPKVVTENIPDLNDCYWCKLEFEVSTKYSRMIYVIVLMFTITLTLYNIILLCKEHIS